MIVSFINKDIREIFEDKYITNENYSQIIAQLLHNRIADLFSANSIYDIIVGSPKEIFIENKSYFQIQLKDGYSIILKPVIVNSKETETNNTDWTKVNRIMITEIRNGNV